MSTLGNVTTLVIQTNGSGTVQVYDVSKESLSLSDGEINFISGQSDRTFVYSGNSEQELVDAIKKKLGPIGDL